MLLAASYTTSVVLASLTEAKASRIIPRPNSRDTSANINDDAVVYTDASADTDSNRGTTIALRRTAHDLQHSSFALRKLLTSVPYSLDTSSAQPQSQAQAQSSSTPLLNTGTTFLAPITLGSQSFLSVLDTGSSDTWIASSEFTCLDPITRRSIPRARCAFGPTYSRSNSSSEPFKQISNENFNITYGDGEFLTGPLGTIDVGLAGLKIPNQTVSLVDHAAWQGDGISSGLIGLAYPDLTAAYPGTDPTRDKYCAPGLDRSKGQCNQLPYASLVDNLFFSQKVVSRKVFALALSRDESNSGKGGYLTFGGLPDLDMVGVKNASRKRLARTKIRMLEGDDRFRYYIVRVDGFAVLPPGTATPGDGSRGGQMNGNGHMLFDSNGETASNNGARNSFLPSLKDRALRPPPPSMPTGGSASRPPPPKPSSTTTINKNESYILDTGTTLSFLPSPLTTRFNSLMNAHIDPSSGFYLVPCTATPPSLGITIAGTTFWHNAKDLIKPYDYRGQMCVSGIQDSSRLGKPRVSILGDVFLNNVLAVFDLGREEVGFAARRDYVS